MCWDDRRRKHAGMSHQDILDKMRSDKKFKDAQVRSRRDRVQQARKPGMEGVDASTHVASEAGAFRQEYDQGHFYDLADYLAIHFSGRKFTSMKEKIEAVESTDNIVVIDPSGNHGVNVSTLPSRAKYKWKAGTEESFKRVCLDELDDSTEAGQFLESAICNSSLQQQQVFPDSVADPIPMLAPLLFPAAHSVSGGDEDEEDGNVDEDVESESAKSVALDDGWRDGGNHEGSQSEAAAPEVEGRLSAANLAALHAPTKANVPSSQGHSPGPKGSPRSNGESTARALAPLVSSFAQRLNRGRSTRALVVPRARPQSLNSSGPSELQLDTMLESGSVSGAGDPAQGKSRRRGVFTLEEAQEAYEEYINDFTADNMYAAKIKLREANAAVDRLRRIGNKVACMMGNAAADLAGKMVAFADVIKPLYDLMDFVRSRPEQCLLRLKPDQIVMFKGFPDQLKQQMLSHISLSILGKLPNSSTKPDDFSLSMHFIRGNSSSPARANAEAKQDTAEIRNISLALMEASGFEVTQNHLLVVQLEALLRVSKADFIKVIRRIRSEGLAPTFDDHNSGAASWHAQSWVDISAISFMGYILESQEPGYKKSRIWFSTMSYMRDSKPNVSVRLKTFRGAKKASGDGDIGRYCWAALDKSTHIVGFSNELKAQNAAALWTQMKTEHALPLDDDMSVAQVKQSFIDAYESDKVGKTLQLAEAIAEVGTEFAELNEAETAINLAMSRYWEVLSQECNESLIDGIKAYLTGDQSDTSFLLRFHTVLELVRQYDSVTLELDPKRPSSVAISELRERLQVATEAFDLSLRICLDQFENMSLWKQIWSKHVKVQNTRPNSDFVLKDEKVQEVLTLLREVSVINLIQSFFDHNLEIGHSPSHALVVNALKLRGELPESIGKVLDRASCMDRIRGILSDAAVGRTSGPCGVTAVRSEAASVLKGFESIEGVESSTKMLDTIWTEAYDNWVHTARFEDFPELHEKFQAVYEALQKGDITGHEWLEKKTETDSTTEAEIQRYQECLLRALPVKSAAGAMAPHLINDSVADEVDKIHKDSTAIVKVSRQVELALAAICMANICLMKPRPKDFDKQLEGAQFFASTVCKVKHAQLPKFVQTLITAESEAALQSVASKLLKSGIGVTRFKAEAMPITPSTAAGNPASSSSPSGVSVPAATDESQPESEPGSLKKRKLA